jgi:hypothetical protein
MWVRIWRSDGIQEECLQFYDDFSGAPRIETSDGGRHFSVVWDGRPASRWWKDWVARFVDELVRVFHEITFDRFDSDG